MIAREAFNKTYKYVTIYIYILKYVYMQNFAHLKLKMGW